MTKKIVNNVEMDMTAKEEAQKVTDAENFQKELNERQKAVNDEGDWGITKVDAGSGSPLTSKPRHGTTLV